MTINVPSTEAAEVGKERGRRAHGVRGTPRHPRLEAGGWPQSLRPLLTPCSGFLSSLRLRKGRCVAHPLTPWSQSQYTPNSSSIRVDHLKSPNLGCSWEANQRGHTLVGDCREVVGVNSLTRGQKRQWTHPCPGGKDVAISGVSLGDAEGWVGLTEGPGFRVEQQPKKLFLFIDITRLLGQVPLPGKGGGAGREGGRG